MLILKSPKRAPDPHLSYEIVIIDMPPQVKMIVIDDIIDKVFYIFGAKLMSMK